MTPGRKIALRALLVVLAVALAVGIGWAVSTLVLVRRHIPQAYAAWDTGMLLVAYLEEHDGRWPSSWDQFLAILDSERWRGLPLRGRGDDEPEYALSLRDEIAIDWTFDPANPGAGNPVTPIGGGDFPRLWQGGDPNRMIRDHLAERARRSPAAED